jgi:uncharacterized protein (TIGR03085 family)
MNLAHTERAQLADLFAVLGPDQPTLCEGWDTKDLLIHLLIRERSPLGAVGNRVPLLKGFTDKAGAEYADRPWAELIQEYRSGPPAWNPAGWGKLDELSNAGEMFIHHEDARRGQVGWQPREFDAETVAELTKMAGSTLSKLAVRSSPVGVTADMPGSEPVVLKRGDPMVTLVGQPGELLLWLSGRDDCRVELVGDDEAVASLRKVKRGV